MPDLDDILLGMARGLWITAYADWFEPLDRDEREAHGGPVSLQGVDWYGTAPETPEPAEAAARDLAALYKDENGGVDVVELAKRAAKADGKQRINDEHFGYYLAMMALGTGSSWFDDHEKFPLKKPTFDSMFDGSHFSWSGGDGKHGTMDRYPNPAKVAGLTAKRSATFRDDGTYEVHDETGTLVAKMYRDPESRWWYREDPPGMPHTHYSERAIGFTQAEALACLARRRGHLNLNPGRQTKGNWGLGRRR